MSDYIIYTDSSCDLSQDALNSMNVHYSSLALFLDSKKDCVVHEELSPNEFYTKLRQGSVAKTSAVNSQAFIRGFEPFLKKGIDILYLGMSSGLSTTYNSAYMAARQLTEKYPCRKIITIDTLSVSAGLGLLIDIISRKKEAGATIEEAASYAKEIKTKICHVFTAPDLNYLKRGGRISPTTAAIGEVLGIKPILRVNEQGKLMTTGKVRGKRTALLTLAKKYETNCTNKEEKIYIAHADCRSDAEELSQFIKANNPQSNIIINDIGPAIGAHSGPDTLALFYVGKR